jgi:hypothetical protein
MTLRKYSVIAALFAAFHFALVAGSVWGAVTIALDRGSAQPRGVLESTLMAMTDFLLAPIAFVWEPPVAPSDLMGFAVVIANSVFWGLVFAALVAAISKARMKRAAF